MFILVETWECSLELAA